MNENTAQGAILLSERPSKRVKAVDQAKHNTPTAKRAAGQHEPFFFCHLVASF